jgi:hypothetical protein
MAHLAGTPVSPLSMQGWVPGFPDGEIMGCADCDKYDTCYNF